jgi:hypothetical protein
MSKQAMLLRPWSVSSTSTFGPEDAGDDWEVNEGKLKVTTTSGGGNGSASWFVSSELGNNTSEPGNATAAKAAVDRCAATSGHIGWGAAGITPSANSTEYSIDVKDEIVDIIGRTSWSSGNSITLLLSGPVEDDGGGSCTGSGSESATVETLVASSGKPSLTVVYS